MVNEEVTRQVIAIAKKGNITSAKAILKLMQMLMKEAAKKGKTVKEYIQEKKPVTVKDSKNLKRELNSYGVKFSIKKDLTTGNNIVFFQAKDEKVMEQAFKNAVEKFAGKNKKRESVIEKLHQFKEKVKNTPVKDKIKEKHQEQIL